MHNDNQSYTPLVDLEVESIYIMMDDIVGLNAKIDEIEWQGINIEKMVEACQA